MVHRQSAPRVGGLTCGVSAINDSKGICNRQMSDKIMTLYFFPDRTQSTFTTTTTKEHRGLTGPDSEASTAPFYALNVLGCSCSTVRIISDTSMHSLCIYERDNRARTARSVL